MIRYLLLAGVVVVLQGCSGTRACEKARPYQQAVAVTPLSVPDDLTAPPLRGQAPEVSADAPKQRPDGGCLEDPPPFDPETGDGEAD